LKEPETREEKIKGKIINFKTCINISPSNKNFLKIILTKKKPGKLINRTDS